MDPTTNPYAQWLGLTETTDRPDHYVLLGLSPFESDSHSIKLAADRATARVRSFRPGSQAREWARLLDEIDEARKCLMDTSAKDAYDAQLRSGSVSSPQANDSTQPGDSQSTSANSNGNPAMYPPGVGPAPMPEQPRYGPAGPAPDDAPTSPAASPVRTGDPSLFAPGFSPAASKDDTAQGSPYTSSPARLPMGRSDDTNPSAAPMGDPMAPVGIGAVQNHAPLQTPAQNPSLDPMAPVSYESQAAVAQPSANVDPMAPMAMPVGAGGKSAASLASSSNAESVQAVGNAPIPVGAPAGAAEDRVDHDTAVNAEGKPQRQSGSGKNLLLAGIGATATLAVGIAALLMFWPNDNKPVGPGDNVVAVNPADEPSLPPDEEPVEPTTDTEPPIARPPDAGPDPEPEPPVITPEPEPDPEPEPIIPTPNPGEVGPPIVPPTDPEPPVPEPEPEPVPLTPAEKESLGKALLAARTAMGARDQAAVLEHLAEAKQLARSEEHRAMVKRLEELNHYVKEFWTSVNEAYSNLKPSTTISVTGGEVAIVEVRPDALVIRNFGRNRTILRNEMPSGLAMAIADTWFTDDPANKVVKGALHVVDPIGRKEEARRLWQEAQAAGVDITPLMPVLDDNYDF